MGKQWSRHVSVQVKDGKQYLAVTTPGGGNPQGRNDPDNSITIFESDRKGGATVRYTLTGSSGSISIVNKDGTNAPPAGFTVSDPAPTVTITDEEAATNTAQFSYYVEFGTIKTEDPMITNASDPDLTKKK